MGSDRLPKLLIALNELTSNTLRHTGGPGLLRMWASHDGLYVQVSDSGSLPATAAATPPQFPQQPGQGGYGLALAAQLSDEMYIHPDPATFRLRFRLT
jgi:anti-sigma regulatory factor (Ser/Thr protein kinase)